MATNYEPIGQSDHTPIEHAPGECPREDAGCMFCDGGLFGCDVCGGLEGGMPSECPGEQMTVELVDEVYEGKIDFRNGKWVAESSKYSPASYRKYYA